MQEERAQLEEKEAEHWVGMTTEARACGSSSEEGATTGCERDRVRLGVSWREPGRIPVCREKLSEAGDDGVLDMMAEEPNKGEAEDKGGEARVEDV